ncbi:MAG: TerB family tellurite resistance protein [Elsteraceae bacterium]
MALWGKIIGGAAGFTIGGPLGGLIGAAAGHAVDWAVSEVEPVDVDQATRSIAFTIGVVALSAKMAKADGQVTTDEVAAFRSFFTFDPEHAKSVHRFFDLARRDTIGYESYARQLGRLFADAPDVLEQLLSGLFRIAKADGRILPAEMDYLRSVSALFGLPPAVFDRIHRYEIGISAADESPYTILELPPDADQEAAKAAWLKLVRSHHPDVLAAQGLPFDAVRLAAEQLATINDAYDRLRAQNGWR